MKKVILIFFILIAPIFSLTPWLRPSYMDSKNKSDGITTGVLLTIGKSYDRNEGMKLKVEYLSNGVTNNIYLLKRKHPGLYTMMSEQLFSLNVIAKRQILYSAKNTYAIFRFKLIGNEIKQMYIKEVRSN